MIYHHKLGGGRVNNCISWQRFTNYHNQHWQKWSMSKDNHPSTLSQHWQKWSMSKDNHLSTLMLELFKWYSLYKIKWHRRPRMINRYALGMRKSVVYLPTLWQAHFDLNVQVLLNDRCSNMLSPVPSFKFLPINYFCQPSIFCDLFSEYAASERGR